MRAVEPEHWHRHPPVLPTGRNRRRGLIRAARHPSIMPPQEQWDVVGVLLMIRLNAEHRRLMSKRRVPCLDDYLDRVNLLLWPRFKVG